MSFNGEWLQLNEDLLKAIPFEWFGLNLSEANLESEPWKYFSMKDDDAIL